MRTLATRDSEYSPFMLRCCCPVARPLTQDGHHDRNGQWVSSCSALSLALGVPGSLIPLFSSDSSSSWSVSLSFSPSSCLVSSAPSSITSGSPSAASISLVSLSLLSLISSLGLIGLGLSLPIPAWQNSYRLYSPHPLLLLLSIRSRF